MKSKIFFTRIRRDIVGLQRLTQNQVDGINMILEVGSHLPNEQMAYVLATSAWETGCKFQPVREVGRGQGKLYGKRTGPYGHVYYGRGDVQLTWLENYSKAGAALGVDLARLPDRALENRISKQILVTGMQLGWFAGDKQGRRHTLDRHIRPGAVNFKEARRIVNGIDKAGEIAAMADKFWAALIEAERVRGHVTGASTPALPSPETVELPKPVTGPEADYKPEVKQETTTMNTNMLHNILNFASLVLAALIGFDWVGLGLSAEATAALLATLLAGQNVLKIAMNVMRDGLLGLFKRQPPVVK